MPTATQIFRALIQADASGAVKELRKLDGQVETSTVGVTKQTGKMGDQFKSLGKAMAAAGAGAFAADFLRDSISAASDLEESVNAVNVTFGDSAGRVLALGDNAVKSAGLSKSAFNDAALSVEAFANQIAGPGGDAVGIIDDLITRAADFGSLRNIETGAVLDKFRSALAGESEPLKQLGIIITENTTKSYAYANGIAEVGSQLTEQQKVASRLGQIMEATDVAAGDFANTSASLSNQQKTLTANIENLQASIGEGLTPVLAEVTAGFNDFIEAADASGLVSVKESLALDRLTGSAQSGGKGLGAVTKGFDALGKTVDFFTGGPGPEMSKWTADIATEMGGARSAITEATSAQIESAGASKQATIEYELQRDALRGAAHDADVVAEATLAKAEADLRAEEAAQRHRDAVDDLNDSVDDALSTMFDYESATLALNEAEQDLADATAEAVKIQNDSEASARDKERALIDLRQEQIAVAEEVLATAEAFAREQGAADGSVESFMLQRQELERLKGQFPGLVGEINRYIAELNRIPAVKTTTLVINRNTVNRTLSTRGVSNRVDEFGNLIAGATGGIVTRPTMALIGEAGPEAVIPLNRAPGASALPTGGMGGGTTIGVVNVYPQSANDTPEAIVDAIRKFERRNGAGWRGAA